MKCSKLLMSIVALLCVTSVVEAKKEMVFIGDSSCDTGNFPDLGYGPGSYGTPPFPDGVYPTRFGFSNGAVWSEQLSTLRGVTLTPSRGGGTNFAFGGATSAPFAPPGNNIQPLATVNTNAGVPFINIATGQVYIPSMLEQVNDFLSNRQDVSKRSPVFTHGGGNDFYLTPGVDVTGVTTGNNIVQGIAALNSAGYHNQVYLVQEFGSKSFFAPIDGPAANSFYDGLNQTVIQGTKPFKTIIIDLQSFNTDVLSNTAEYGFLPFTQAELFTPDGGAMVTMTGPNNTPFWWDDVHYGEHYQHIQAEYVHAILDAPKGWAQLSEQPFSVMRGLNAVLLQQLYPITNTCSCIGEFAPFVSGMYSPQETGPFYGSSPHSHGWNGTLGITYRLDNCWTLGLAGSYNEDYFSKHRYRVHRSFNMSSWMLSALSGMQADCGYLNTIVNIGFLKFDDIHRHFAYGPVSWKAIGHTDGMQYDGLIEGGWFLYRNCDCQFGPFATIEYQYDHINGYTEQGASYNDLQYKSQHNQSLVTGLGLDFDMRSPWQLFCGCDSSLNVFLSANADWLSTNRSVYFRQPSIEGQFSVEPGYGRWKIYNETSFFGSGGISLTNSLSNGGVFTLGYLGNIGQHNMREHFLTASFSFPFGFSNQSCSEGCSQ